MEIKFNVSHVGGRSGSIEFPKDTLFNDSISYSIFEADETCIEQIKRTNPLAQVYPFCIDEKNGEKDFYLKIKKKEMNLPKLWHKNLAENYSEKVSNIDKSVDLEYFKKNIYSKAMIRLTKNPILFIKIVISYILKKIKLIFLEIMPVELSLKKNSKFGNYLKKYKLFMAARRVNSQS